jgi:UDP-3-O-[3-hydroxymyristoyl] glucosamine N-acyltransferase
MGVSLHALAAAISADLIGPGDVEISNVASIRSAGERDLVFAEDEGLLWQALSSGAAAIIAGEFARAIESPQKPLLIAPQAKLAFARAAKIVKPASTAKTGVHPSAVIDASASVASSASIGPNACVEAGASIGAHSRVGPGTVVGENAVIGERCFIEGNVTIYPRVRVGNNVRIHSGAVLGSDGFGYVRDRKTGRYEQFPQVGGLIIEDDVEIGAAVTIDRGALENTVIGRGTKIDNLVHVGHNVSIEEDVVIAAQTGISGSVEIKRGAIIGGQVGIGDHARIEEGVILGSGSGVLTKKIVRGKGIVFWGTPAKPLRQYLRELAALARLARRSE